MRIKYNPGNYGLMPVITRAPEGMGGGGGVDIPPFNMQSHGGDGGAGGDSGEFHDTSVPLFGQEDQGNGVEDVLAMFAPADGANNDDDEDPGELGGFMDVPQEQIAALEQDIITSIQGMSVGNLPENFDVTDPQQFQNYMNHVMRETVKRSLGVVFKPVQLAINQMQNQVDSRMDHKIKQSSRLNRETDIIVSEVPEINDPKHRAFLQPLNESLKAQKKTPQERAVALRKVLNQMGITPTKSNQRGRGGSNQESSGLRTGKSALDSFFGSSGNLFDTPKPPKK